MPHSVNSLLEVLDRNATGTITGAYLATLDRRIKDKQAALAIAKQKLVDAGCVAAKIERELNGLSHIARAIRSSRSLPPETPKEEN